VEERLERWAQMAEEKKSGSWRTNAVALTEVDGPRPVASQEESV
jgi:hypothetical protein